MYAQNIKFVAKYAYCRWRETYYNVLSLVITCDKYKSYLLPHMHLFIKLVTYMIQHPLYVSHLLYTSFSLSNVFNQWSQWEFENWPQDCQLVKTSPHSTGPQPHKFTYRNRVYVSVYSEHWEYTCMVTIKYKWRIWHARTCSLNEIEREAAGPYIYII